MLKTLSKALIRLVKNIFQSINKFFILLDLLGIVLMLRLALIIRFDNEIPSKQILLSYKHLPVLLLTAFIINHTFSFYLHLWKYAGTRKYLQLMAGNTLQIGLVAAFMMILDNRLPWTVYFIYWILMSVYLTGYRIVYRQAHRRISTHKMLSPKGTNLVLSDPKLQTSSNRRVLIFGAGQAGYEIVRDLQENPRGKSPVVLLDDDKALHNHRILGVKVLGGREKLDEAVQTYQIDLIILAIPSASADTIRDLIEIAQKTGCELKVLPKLSELYDQKITFAKTRDIEISDLLGRSELNVNLESIGTYLTAKSVLVTGGGGSIGSELCRQIARLNPKNIIIFDIYENNAFQLENELKLIYGDKLKIVVLIGSVRDPERLRTVFDQYHPQVVFHAAAHKQVPLMEGSPGEAVKNNVMGTFNVAKLAGDFQVEQFVLISTDKAVNPTNVMGATKRLAEIIIQNLSKKYPKTRYGAVRFGNVLGSNGSVVPLFQNQIKIQQKVTVTHPEITRYFMTIPEAAKLVIEAGGLAQNGDIFVLDMGQPVKIVDLARELIRLNGFEPDVDIKIEYSGLRPGEKMYEELYLDLESLALTKNKHIFILKPILERQKIEAEIDILKAIIRTGQSEIDDLFQKKVLS